MTWFTVVTAPRKERRIISELADLGIEAWTPQERRWRHIGRRKVESGNPIFPGYVFVWMARPRFSEVAEVQGVREFVHTYPVAALDRWVPVIRWLEGRGKFDHTKPRHVRRLTIGDRAMIRDGADKGKVVEIIDGGTDNRLRVLLGWIVATIDTGRLEPLKEAA